MQATHKEIVVGNNTLKPGQFITSYLKAAHSLRMSEKRVRNRLNELERLACIIVERAYKGAYQGAQAGSKISLVKWEGYQTSGEKKKKKGVSGGVSKGTIQEDKKIKKKDTTVRVAKEVSSPSDILTDLDDASLGKFILEKCYYHHLPKNPKLKKWTKGHADLVRLRMGEHEELRIAEGWDTLFFKASENEWWNKVNHPNRKWQAKFKWLLAKDRVNDLICDE